MKKYCKNCGEFEADPDEKFCPKCGSPFDEEKFLSDRVDSPVYSSVQPATVQQDNRIHKGDNVTVGGDNFNAQNVDNRTVTNTNNTTINNINNIVDESRKVVQCELSGKTVQIIDTVVCPKCKRRVSKEYYVEGVWLCQDCYQKKLQAEQADPIKQKVGIPPIMPDVSLAQQTGRPERTNIRVEPIGEYTVKRNRTKYFVYGGLFAVFVLVAGIFILKDKEDELLHETTPPQVNAIQETPKQIAPSASSTTSVVKSQQEVSVKTAKTEIEKPQETVVPSEPKLSQFELGKNAYDAGEYTKAALHLEKALRDGKVGAAYYLAMMYKQGKGVSKNVRQAFTYMKQAAEGGVSNAYYELAEMYRLGKGTEPNRSLAKKWYEEAVTSNALNADKASNALTKYNR